MNRKWKTASLLLLGLSVLGGGGFLWMLAQPPAPAHLTETGPTGQRIDDHGIFANYFPSKGKEKKPAILLLGGSEGGLGKDVRAQALLLQQEGYHTLQLAYHNAPGKSSKLENVPLEEFYRGLDWLKSQPGVDGTRLAIVGYSKGAEAGLLVATRYPGIKAVVFGMPSSVVWDGMSGFNYLFGSFSSSWSEDGKPVPHLAYKGFPDKTGLLPVFVNGLRHVETNPAAIIPVEKFKGKALLICGKGDTVWPSCKMADQISARSARSGISLVSVLKYEGAGHGVMGAPLNDPKRIKYWSQMGGTPLGNASSRRDSWPRIIEFLAHELRPK